MLRVAKGCRRSHWAKEHTEQVERKSRIESAYGRMACWTQHHFELDFALRHASWRPAERCGYAGWRAGAAGDSFNRAATFPDEVGDWLCHKENR